MSLLAIVLVLIGGIWIGVVVPEGRRGAFPLLGMSLFFFVLAMVFLWLCERLTFADMLLARYVSDQSCVFGGFETRTPLSSYIFILGAGVAAIRSKLTKPLPKHDASDI